jgi:GNAT superfamily N-acetyltransferase
MGFTSVAIDDVIIRPANDGDVAQIVGMDSVARQALQFQRGGPEWLTEHQALVEWDPQHLVSQSLVAQYADAIVGFLLFTIAERPGRGLVLTVDRVFVEELARELGCGDGLLALATEIAVSQGCRSIEGNSLPGDRETKNLYERASMKARKIVTGRDL